MYYRVVHKYRKMKNITSFIFFFLAICSLQAAEIPDNKNEAGGTRTIAPAAAAGALAMSAMTGGGLRPPGMGIQPGMMSPMMYQQSAMMYQRPGMMYQQPGMNQQFMYQQPGFNQQMYPQQSNMMYQQQPGLLNQQQAGMMYQQQPGMMYQQQPGMMYQQQPGMMYQQQPGMMYQQQQGMMYQQQPGMMYQQQPGMMYQQQPGMMYQQQPGMMYQQQPWMMYQQPGMMYQQPQYIQQGGVNYQVVEVPAIMDDYGNFYYQDLLANGQYQYTLIPPELIVRSVQEKEITKKMMEETPGLDKASFKPTKTATVSIKVMESQNGSNKPPTKLNPIKINVKK